MELKKTQQTIFFELYDQLDEPMQSQAKGNWDYNYSIDINRPPINTVQEAIMCGFDWTLSPEGADYWTNTFKLSSKKQTLDSIETNIGKVKQWAHNKGIFEKATKFKQAEKTLEECGELIYAIGTNNHNEIKDAIGDIIVTLIIQADMNNLSIEECLQSAYDVIKSRTGKMIGGTFVKD